MAEKTRKIVLLLLIYLLMFWIGFRSGEIHNRMRNKIEIEKIAIPESQPPPLRYFYIVENQNFGHYSYVNFAKVEENNPIIQFFLNKKLRPLLKLRNLKIYSSKGDRIY